MNKERRKAINLAIKDLLTEAEKIDGLRGQIEDLKSNFEAGKDTLGGLKDEEEEYKEAMPESFQQGEKGSKADEAISNLEEANMALDEVMGKLDEALEGLQTAIDAMDDINDQVNTAESSAQSATEG